MARPDQNSLEHLLARLTKDLNRDTRTPVGVLETLGRALLDTREREDRMYERGMLDAALAVVAAGVEGEYDREGARGVLEAVEAILSATARQQERSPVIVQEPTIEEVGAAPGNDLRATCLRCGAERETTLLDEALSPFTHACLEPAGSQGRAVVQHYLEDLDGGEPPAVWSDSLSVSLRPLSTYLDGDAMPARPAGLEIVVEVGAAGAVVMGLRGGEVVATGRCASPGDVEVAPAVLSPQAVDAVYVEAAARVVGAVLRDVVVEVFGGPRLWLLSGYVQWLAPRAEECSGR